MSAVLLSNSRGVHRARQPSTSLVRKALPRNGSRNRLGRMTRPLASSACSWVPQNLAPVPLVVSLSSTLLLDAPSGPSPSRHFSPLYARTTHPSTHHLSTFSGFSVAVPP